MTDKEKISLIRVRLSERITEDENKLRKYKEEGHNKDPLTFGHLKGLKFALSIVEDIVR